MSTADRPDRTSRRGAAVAVALALASPLVPAVPARAAVGDCAPGADWGVPRPDLAGRVVALVNAHRAGLGLPLLAESVSLTASAVWKARHMARHQYLQHDDPAPPVARGTGDRLAACGYPAGSAWGENIAFGQATADAVMRAWLSSTGHRAHIEDPNARAIGVGAAVSAAGRVYWTQDFGARTDSGPAVAPAPAPAPVPPPVPPPAPAVPAPAPAAVVATRRRPRLAITRAPAAVTRSRVARFRWRAGGARRAVCVLDRGRPRLCRTRVRYRGLAPGRHTFTLIVRRHGWTASLRYSWTVRGRPHR